MNKFGKWIESYIRSFVWLDGCLVGYLNSCLFGWSFRIFSLYIRKGCVEWCQNNLRTWTTCFFTITSFWFDLCYRLLCKPLVVKVDKRKVVNGDCTTITLEGNDAEIVECLFDSRRKSNSFTDDDSPGVPQYYEVCKIC